MDEETGPDQSDPPMLTHVTRRAMATEFVVMLPESASGDQVEVVVDTLELLDAFERALTIYRDDSEISMVNRHAEGKPVPLSPGTFRLMQQAIQWSQRTGGAFDVTAGPLVETWGFTNRSGRKPDAESISAARNKVGYQDLGLDADQRTIRFLKPGMSINLGAIGKGDAIDRMARTLRQHGLNHFLIHGGNSSILGSGDQVPGSGQGWPVGLAHPTKPKHRVAGIWLRDMALATSGSGKQFFHHRGRRYGHVIDPRTGYPAGDLLSLTVLMPSAADADACATGLFVLSGQERSELSQQPWFPAQVVIRSSGRQDQVEVHWHGEIPWADPPSHESTDRRPSPRGDGDGENTGDAECENAGDAEP